jgi:hypothetical protein
MTVPPDPQVKRAAPGRATRDSTAHGRDDSAINAGTQPKSQRDRPTPKRPAFSRRRHAAAPQRRGRSRGPAPGYDALRAPKWLAIRHVARQIRRQGEDRALTSLWFRLVKQELRREVRP